LTGIINKEYIWIMASLDTELNKLTRIVEKYCIKGKEDDALEGVEWARGYADDFPQEEDRAEAVRLVRKAGRYITDEGKAQYEEAAEAVIQRLGNLRAS
jgi:hypothetical protein